MDRELLLIRMLLVMGCVERNPGPPVKKFTFRYQYLLIYVGTQVIRKIFDRRARPNLMTFLTNNNAKLQVMIEKKIITPVQEELLPPNEPNPSSEHFDITLICSLLRNICGLRPPGDNVWIQPKSTDTSLEAYITRLRLCRNKVSHSKSVLEDQTILKDKWTELCDILTELSKFCNFQDLTTIIKTAENIEIDEQLKERFEATLKLWDEMENMFDRRQGEIVNELGAMNKRLDGLDAILEKIDDKIEQTIQTKDCQRVDDTSETEVVRQKLIDIYLRDFGYIQLCPLVENEIGQIFKFYQVPGMKVVDYHKTEKQQTEQSHSGHISCMTLKDISERNIIKCKDIFCKDDKQCKNIYLTADAGLGKTTFSKVMAFLWCYSKIGNQIENDKMQEYADYLARFEFVFHINLRDTQEVNVVSMIMNQLKPYLSDEKYVNLHETIEQFLKSYESLVILDGLDEWAPKQIDKQKCQLPIRPESSKCVYLTLCRPYKIENVRLSRLDIDHQINMIGFNEKAIESYVAALVHYINIINDENKDPKKFLDGVDNVGLSFLLHIPMIASQLVMLWFNDRLTSMSRSMIYGNIMDLLFKIAHERGINIPAQTSFYLRLPDALSDLCYLKTNFSLVRKLCLLSYRLCFEHDIKITSLVFTREQLASDPYNLSEEETNLFCKIGILSKSQVYRRFAKQELTVGFLHNSYLEFLAAVYVSTLETSQVLDLFNTCTTINDVLKFETFLIFYAGLSPEGIKSLISRIYSLLSDDLITKRNLRCHSNFPFPFERFELDMLDKFIDMILTCYVEGPCRVHTSILLEDMVFETSYDYTCIFERIVCESLCNYHTFARRSMVLKELLSLNGKNVKFLKAIGDEYCDEFDKITNLQWLSIKLFDLNCYNVKFNELMLQHLSSLHTVRIRGNKIRLDLPINSLEHLTSLTLMHINLSHECLQNTVNFLSNNSLLKLVCIEDVKCFEHQENSPDCTISCDFSDCNKLENLQLEYTNISCSNVNVSSLKEMSLTPLSQNIAACYDGIFDCLQRASALSSFRCNGYGVMHSGTVKHLIACIQFLPSLKILDLCQMEIPNNIHLTLHPDVTEFHISLKSVTLGDTSFKSLMNNLTKIQEATLWSCIITQADGDNLNKWSEGKSFVFMCNYLLTISSTVSITFKRRLFDPSYISFKVGQ